MWSLCLGFYYKCDLLPLESQNEITNMTCFVSEGVTTNLTSYFLRSNDASPGWPGLLTFQGKLKIWIFLMLNSQLYIIDNILEKCKAYMQVRFSKSCRATISEEALLHAHCMTWNEGWKLLSLRLLVCTVDRIMWRPQRVVVRIQSISMRDSK